MAAERVAVPHVVQVDLAGRTALVTGGGSGIGRACALRLAAAGAEVLVVDRNAEAAKAVAAETGGRAVVADLADGAAVDALDVDVDVLVNNAGFQHVAPLPDFPPDAFAQLQRVMVDAPFRLVRQALPHMYERGWGRIVTISSVHGLRASPYKAAYVTAKHGLEGLSKVVALEGAPHGVTVQLHQPGIRAHPARGGPDRRPGEDPRHPRVGGGRADHAGPLGDQAAGRAGGGGRGPGVPVLPGRRVHHRHLDRHGRRMDGELSRMDLMTASGEVDYLELLAREAAAVEFEGPLLAARAAGVPAERLAELEQAKLAALRVRSLLERRRRREAELSGLVDTAADLAGLRDVDAVLRAIVHRARTLLGADVAYLTLNDDARGDTYMRVTDGSVSARFQRLRLPLGAGLGGLVAQTGTPYVTADYANDERFRHTGEIDAGVRRGGAGRHPRRAAAARVRRRSACCSPPTARPARSPARRWRCWARWPRTRPWRSTPPGCSPRRVPRWPSCPPPTRRSARTAARSSGPRPPTTG